MVVIPAIEDAIRSAHSATSPHELEQALGIAESLAHHAMTETTDEEVREYSADVLMRYGERQCHRTPPKPAMAGSTGGWRRNGPLAPGCAKLVVPPASVGYRQRHTGATEKLRI
jgi:hypothetical protein